MKTLSRFVLLASAGLPAIAAFAQFGLPRIVQLPTEDFTFVWGENVSIDDRDRPDFTIPGSELPFDCSLTGSFRPGSHMRDYYNQREFELTLSQTLYFIQDSTNLLNQLYQSIDLDWAILECVIPDSSESDEATQERLDKALERAEKQRERRREREARDDD